MTNGFEQAQERRSWLERLVDKIPGFKGYQNRELRRDVDKMQRDYLAGQVDHVRHGIQGKIRAWSRSGNLKNLELAASIEKLLDRLGNRIRHADYGTSGFFDAVKIGENELAELYRFDVELNDMVERLGAEVDALADDADEDALLALLDAVEQADRSFDERATTIENVTQKGA